METFSPKQKRALSIFNFKENMQRLSVYLFVFVATAYFFYWLSPSANLADPDSFYHAKMAELISQEGVIKSFPWFQYTILNNYYTDHHLLYHLLLIPFVKISAPLWGIKISVIFFAGLLAAVFVWFLNKFGVRAPVFYWLIFLTSSASVFRFSLVKANSPSLIFLLFGLYAVFSRRPVLLFFISFFYVWLYGGWPLMGVLVLFYLVGVFFEQLIGRFSRKDPPDQKVDFIRYLIKKESAEAKILLACLAGLIGGVVFNPYFPNNLFFYYDQLVKIGVLNYQNLIGVGAEWYPYQFKDLVGGLGLVSLLFIVGAIFFFKDFFRQNRQTITLLLLGLFFQFLTLKSRRYVEYAAPFTILASAFIINHSWKEKTFAKTMVIAKSFDKFQKIILGFALICLLLIYAIVIGQKAWENKASLSSGASFDKFSKASLWIIKNTNQGEIIFHDNWDSSPILFYHNTHNYYLVGLDPTFMYLYDKDLYWHWANITTGKQALNLKETILEKFRSHYVFVDKEHQLMENNLSRSDDFIKVYADEEASVYRIK